MRRLTLLLAITCSLVAHGQFQDDRIDPFVNLHVAAYPIWLKGIQSLNGSTTFIGSSARPTDPQYTTVETKALVLATMVQGGVDINAVMQRDRRIGARVGGGLGRHSGVSNADGLNSLAYEAQVSAFYRAVLNDLELAGFLGYKHVWTVFEYDLIIAGIELDLDENLGVMLSGSVNKHKYYRLFTNGFEEPAFSIRELGVTLVYRF